jgi:hypothetical protein
MAERAYLADPETRSKLSSGDISGVLSSAPGMNLDRALKLGELNSKNEDRKDRGLDRKSALEARLYDIETRAADRTASREQQAALATAAQDTRRELAEMGFQVRREIAANRPGPSPIATDQGLFQMGPNGLAPLMNPNKPGQQLMPPSLVSGSSQRAIALRKMYDSNPEVKLANSLEPKVGPIAQYVAEVGKGMGNSVGDAELVKLWLMTTHPKGDQISNLDYRTIEKMPDLWGRVKNVAGNFVFGKTLDADTRKDMWNSISQKFKATHAMRQKYKADVLGRGKQMGIDESLIFAPAQE